MVVGPPLRLPDHQPEETTVDIHPDTVRIVAEVTDENPTGYVVINKADFDPKVHKLYKGPDWTPPSVDGEGQTE